MEQGAESEGGFVENSQHMSTVQMGILGVWALLAIDVASAVANRWTVTYSQGQTVATILLFTVFSIIPCKLQMKRNGLRYVRAVLNGIGVAFMRQAFITACPAGYIKAQPFFCLDRHAGVHLAILAMDVGR